MNILNIMNFLNFLNNMNYDVEAEKSHLPAIIFVECFVSIHMTVFVLKPLSKMISKDNSKIVFYILFGIRAAVLIYCDIIGYYGIAIIDFLAIFVGTFIIIPLLRKITGTNRSSGHEIDDFYIQNRKSTIYRINGHDIYKSPITDRSDDPDFHMRPVTDISDDPETAGPVSTFVMIKCDICGDKYPITYKYCPGCGSLLTGNIVNEENDGTGGTDNYIN